MNVGDLLDARVLDADGAQIGVVIDVRLALEVVDEPDDGPGGRDDREDRDDPPLSELDQDRDAVGAARLVGLLVGPRPGSYLGYERTGVTSPWPVPQLVRRRHRGTFLVPWGDVAEVGRHESEVDGKPPVRLAPGYAELSPELG